MRAKVTGLQIRSGEVIAFRSALEARWAYFFDLLAMNWQYEPFTRELPQLGFGYTPDFEVREIGVIEIKPTWGMVSESRTRIRHYIAQSGRPIYLFCGGSPINVVLYRIHGNPPTFFRLSRMQQMVVLGGVDRRKFAIENYETFCTSILTSLRSASGHIKFDTLNAMQKWIREDSREAAKR